MHDTEFDRVVGCMDQTLFGARISFRSLYGRVTEKQLDLFKLTAGCPAELGASASEVMRCKAWNADHLCVVLEHLPHNLLPQAFTSRPASAAADVQASIATLTHVGSGAVRTRPWLPTRSTMHQRPSRCWI